ncbi:MAG: DUF1641 domain-containing protein [Myxococcota bacterium]
MAAVVDPLERLEARLAAIEAKLDRISAAVGDDRLRPALGLAAQIEPAIAMAGDAIDEWAGRQIARGVDPDAHVRHALTLAERLTDPAVAGRLERLIELLPRLLPVAELAATFEPTTAMLFDMLDEQVRRLDERGVDAESRFHQVTDLVERLTDPEFHAHLSALLDAAPNLMAATRTGELFGRAVDQVIARAPEPVGLFGLLRALSDPNVQRAVGFALAVADQVGRELPSSTTAPVRA